MDEYWTQHLTAIEDMRSGINLRAYAQLDPLVEYKNEAYSLFETLLANVRYEFIRRLLLLKFDLVTPTLQEKVEDKSSYLPASRISAYEAEPVDQVKAISPAPPMTSDKIGRNDPCPCGAIDPKTSKVYKYKKCGLVNAPTHKI